MNRFEGKVAIVTGGSSGIGYATAKRFAAEGAHVVICGLDAAKGEQAAHSLGDRVTFIKTDVRNEDDVSELVKQTLEIHGQLNIVVNSAGVSVQREVDVTTFSLEDYNRTMDTNTKGVFLVTKYSIPHLLKTKGTIINIASRLGLRPLKNDAFIYSTSKAAVIMFTKAVALSYKAQELRINCVCPGAVDTALLRGTFESEEEFREFTKEDFHGRAAIPEDQANVIAFLASDEASYVNGAVWSVDGGSAI